MDKISLPICIPYLKEQSTSQQNYVQLSLSLIEKLIQHHFPDQKDIGQLSYSLLKTAPMMENIPELSKIQPVSGISCRKVQNLLKCRALCAACPYAASYQNQMETDEAIVLSYILQDYSNFACLCSYHIKTSFFKAVFCTKEKEAFLNYPLHRSLYQYMQEHYQLGMQRNELLRSYLTFLKSELEQAFSASFQRLVQTYINNLIKMGSGITLEHVNTAIHNIEFQKESIKKKKADPSPSAGKNEGPSILSLDYMLSAGRQPKIIKSEPELTPYLIGQLETPEPALSSPAQEFPGPASTILSDFHFSMEDLAGYARFELTAASAPEEFEFMENKLLLSSFISLEGAVCTEDGEDYILLYTDGCYFIFSPACSDAVKILASLLKRNCNARRFLSFDGYYLSWLLSSKSILPEHIVSLQQTFRFLHKESSVKYERTPEELVTLLENRNNSLGLSFYCYAMKYYPHMYRQMSTIPAERQLEYQTDRFFHQLLGLSYYLPAVDAADKRSFNLDGLGSLTFLFPELKSSPEHCLACFKIELFSETAYDIEIRLLKPALSVLYSSSFCLLSEFKLVFLGKDEIRICFKPQYREKISESFHMLFSYYAERDHIYIKVIEETM